MIGTDENRAVFHVEVNAESKPSWTRARSAAKKLLANCEIWDKAMRDFAAKNLTASANEWLADEGETDQQAFILDLFFNPEITDELMAVYFDLNKEIFFITYEC